MTDSDAAFKDFEYSRKTYYDLIEKGQDALEEMMEVAKALEHPRAFEVVAGMIKNISDVNDRLAELHKKRKAYMKDEDKKEEIASSNNTTNNNVFIGSTNDLRAIVMAMDESDKDIVDIDYDEEK